MTAIRILGLDPGLQRTGWGVIEVAGNHVRSVAHGTITTETKHPLETRLHKIFENICDIIQRCMPLEVAVEEVFVNKNPVSSLKLGMARGVVIMTPAHQGLPVFEYSANHVKKAIVGAGHADKEQVAFMVSRLLPGSSPDTFDAADALAVALCHMQHRTFERRRQE